MSGVHRLLTRRDKRSKSKSGEDGDFGGVFICDARKKPDKKEEKRIENIQTRLQSFGITRITPANILYALRVTASSEDNDDALRLCILLEDTYEGLLVAFDPKKTLIGAVNREGVTCYLDALLFAMFARLDGFEAMLYNSLEDAPRKKLAGLLRLWVNLLRSGRLITVDITKHVQNALTDCGWEPGIKLEQQDTSELFTFITGQLELPLLTLKMDLFHTGKEEPDDDHRFINERLLDVAILQQPKEGKSEITLEDCLEHYFNNRVEVSRHLEQHLKYNTKLGGAAVAGSDPDNKISVSHIETVEISENVESPKKESFSPHNTVLEDLTSSGRGRADSIFAKRCAGDEKVMDDPSTNQSGRQAKKTRTEVLMPAWQFFKLLPWYADNMPTSDAQVAAHFASKRPILGICLKRYMISNTGVSSRLDTYVDIPLEIALPDFVSDDNMHESSPLVGNFKLVLQSVVCHRGRSLHSGHYVSLVRRFIHNRFHDDGIGVTNDDGDLNWMLFDDMARERVRSVDINRALREECPYLLFYQVQPIHDDDPTYNNPPSYAEAMSRSNSANLDVSEKLALPDFTINIEPIDENMTPTKRHSMTVERSKTIAVSDSRSRMSMDTPNTRRTHRSSMSSDIGRTVTNESNNNNNNNNRGSVIYSTSRPPTPNEETSRLGFLNLSRRTPRPSVTRSSSKGKDDIVKTNQSRPTSVGPESRGRFSLNMSRLTTRLSRTELTPVTSGMTPSEPAELTAVSPSEDIADQNQFGISGVYDTDPEQQKPDPSASHSSAPVLPEIDFDNTDPSLPVTTQITPPDQTHVLQDLKIPSRAMLTEKKKQKLRLKETSTGPRDKDLFTLAGGTIVGAMKRKAELDSGPERDCTVM